MKTLLTTWILLLGLVINANAQLYSIYDLDLDLFPETKKHIIYTEFMGMNGFAGFNYMPAIIAWPNGIVAIRGKVGVGMTNNTVFFPHGLLLTVGNTNHQLEIGYQGSFKADYGQDKTLDFLYGNDAQMPYVHGPVLGYRLIAENGLTLNINCTLIGAKQAQANPDPEIPLVYAWNYLPWFAMGIGYAF